MSMDTLVLIMIGIGVVVLLGIYHSVFNVVYFSPQGCVTEIIIATILSYAIVVLGFSFILEYWKIILGIIAVLVIGKIILSK